MAGVGWCNKVSFISDHSIQDSLKIATQNGSRSRAPPTVNSSSNITISIGRNSQSAVVRRVQTKTMDQIILLGQVRLSFWCHDK